MDHIFTWSFTKTDELKLAKKSSRLGCISLPTFHKRARQGMKISLMLALSKSGFQRLSWFQYR